MNELSTALPSAWIDRLFDRFAVLYGKHWFDMWVDVPVADIKDAWATELAGVTGEQIAAALKGLGKFPPTLPEFVALCKQPSAPPVHRLLLPDRRPRAPIPQHIREQFAKLREQWSK